MIYFCGFNYLPIVLLLDIQEYSEFEDYTNLLNTSNRLFFEWKYSTVLFRIKCSLPEAVQLNESILRLRSRLKNCHCQLEFYIRRRDSDMSPHHDTLLYQFLDIEKKSICLDIFSPAKCISFPASNFKKITCNNFKCKELEIESATLEEIHLSSDCTIHSLVLIECHKLKRIYQSEDTKLSEVLCTNSNKLAFFVPLSLSRMHLNLEHITSPSGQIRFFSLIRDVQDLKLIIFWAIPSLMPFAEQLAKISCLDLSFPRAARLRDNSPTILPICPVLYGNKITLEFLNLSEWNNVKQIPSCKKISLVQCEGITSFPSMDNLLVFFIRLNSSITTIPTFISCKSMHLIGCQNLIHICAQPKLDSIYIEECPHLVTISELETCQSVSISYCPLLTDYHSIRNCKYFDIGVETKIDFNSLVELLHPTTSLTLSRTSLTFSDTLRFPPIQNVYSMCLSNLSIEVIDVPCTNLHSFYIQRCGKLREISTCSDIHELSISTCCQLRKMNSFINIKKFCLFECANLESWGRFDNIDELSIREVPLLAAAIKKYEISADSQQEFRGINQILSFPR
jgi:hypothetical protein